MTLGIPFNELGSRISAAELVLYQVYYRNSPWGEERADLRNAMSMCQNANMHRDPSKGKAFEISDFMPFAEKPKPVETDGEPAGLRDVFRAMAKRSKK